MSKLTLGRSLAAGAIGAALVISSSAHGQCTPALKGALDTSDALGVAVAGNVAYVANGQAGLLVIDVSDPTSPTPLQTLALPGWAVRVAVAGDHAFVAGSDALHVVDVSSPGSPSLVRSHGLPQESFDVAVDDGMVAVVGRYGLQLVDVTDPAHSELRGAYALFDVRGVTMADGLAYVADSGDGLRIIDVSDPTTPALVGSYLDGGYWEAVAVVDDVAYLGGFSGLKVIGVSNPSAPWLIQHDHTITEADDFATAGTMLFVVGYDPEVLDVSNPASPLPIGVYPTGHNCRSGAFSNGDVYLAARHQGLDIVDVTGCGTVPCCINDGCLDVGFADCVSVSGASMVTFTTCDSATCPPSASCPEDVDRSGHVGMDDLLAVLHRWGLCPSP